MLNLSSTPLQYITCWETGPVHGESQVVTLHTQSTRVLYRSIVNKRSNAHIINYPTLAPGKYELRAALHQYPNGQGPITGTLHIPVEFQGNPLTIQTTAGPLPTQLTVTPSRSSTYTKESVDLYIKGEKDNKIVFLNPAATRAHSTTGRSIIHGTGLTIEETHPGRNIVTVNYSTTNLTSTCSYDVHPETPQKTLWNILIYINAACDLFTYSFDTIEPILENTTHPGVRYIIQWKQSEVGFPATFNATKRAIIESNPSTGKAEIRFVQDLGSNIDIGSPRTHHDFIQWAIQTYPAERVAYIGWGHGNGHRRAPTRSAQSRAFSYDAATDNAINAWELPQAFGNHTLDLLVWDASLMQQAEVAYQIRNKAKFIVGSPESPPGEGYPYSIIAQAFNQNPHAPTKELAKVFVDAMVNHPPYKIKQITESVLDTSQLPNLVRCTNDLKDQLILHSSQLEAIIPHLRSQTQKYGVSHQRYYDVIDFAEKLKNANVPPPVAEAATRLATATKSCIIYEKHNANIPNAYGLSIDLSDSRAFAEYDTDYARLEFHQDTGWGDWLRIAP